MVPTFQLGVLITFKKGNFIKPNIIKMEGN